MIEHQKQGPYIVEISGVPQSGKSLVAEALVEKLTRQHPSLSGAVMLKSQIRSLEVTKKKRYAGIPATYFSKNVNQVLANLDFVILEDVDQFDRSFGDPVDVARLAMRHNPAARIYVIRTEQPGKFKKLYQEYHGKWQELVSKRNRLHVDIRHAMNGRSCPPAGTSLLGNGTFEQIQHELATEKHKRMFLRSQTINRYENMIRSQECTSHEK